MDTGERSNLKEILDEFRPKTERYQDLYKKYEELEKE